MGISKSLHSSLVSCYRVECARTMNGRVLDCGGGLGCYLPYFGSDDVIVVDISLPALRELSHFGKICANGLHLPFAERSFDSVWACAVAQYMPLQPFVREVMRVTKPGGRILILVPNGKSPWDWLKKRLGMEGWWDQAHIVNQYSPDDLKPYGKVSGEIRFLWGERLLRNIPRLGHTLMLEIQMPGESA